MSLVQIMMECRPWINCCFFHPLWKSMCFWNCKLLSCILLEWSHSLALIYKGSWNWMHVSKGVVSKPGRPLIRLVCSVSGSIKNLSPTGYIHPNLEVKGWVMPLAGHAAGQLKRSPFTVNLTVTLVSNNLWIGW